MLNAAAGPPKGISKLLTVSESGRMRSPPLVEKFRRAKENMLQNWQSQPINGKLLSLERMFHEVSRCVYHTVRGFHKTAALLCVVFIHPLPHPLWVQYTPRVGSIQPLPHLVWVSHVPCLTLCGFNTPPCGFHTPFASFCMGSIHPLPHLGWVSHTPCLILCGFPAPPASPCAIPLQPLPHLNGPAALQARLYEFLH